MAHHVARAAAADYPWTHGGGHVLRDAVVLISVHRILDLWLDVHSRKGPLDRVSVDEFDDVRKMQRGVHDCCHGRGVKRWRVGTTGLVDCQFS